MHRRSDTFRFVTMAGRTSGETVKAPKGQMSSSLGSCSEISQAKGQRRNFIFYGRIQFDTSFLSVFSEVKSFGFGFFSIPLVQLTAILCSLYQYRRFFYVWFE